MFCIASFIVLGILAIFSATYRPLAAKAWHCVVRRVTLRPCDISFGEEMKGRILGALVLRHPHAARFLNRWFDWIAFAFVALSVWSLVSVAHSGLNLWVYDTCDPASAESCSLSGEACGVEQAHLGLVQAVSEGRIGEWATGPFVRFGETLSRIPDRLKTWDAHAYLAPGATFLRPEDPAKPYALEVIDPGCKFCKKLTGNMMAARLYERANVSYLLYPIPLPDGGTKFPHSPLMAAYIEAAKHVRPDAYADAAPPDWRLLEAIFSPDLDADAIDLQTRMNMGYTRAQAEEKLRELLRGIGYTSAQVEEVARAAASPEVASALAEQRRIVEEEIRTIKIPTFLYGGRRYDRVIGEERMR